MSADIVAIRREVCAHSCDQKCAAHKAGRVAFEDPCASCPRSDWILAWGTIGGCQQGRSTFARQGALGRIPMWRKAVRLAAALARWARGGFGLVERHHRTLRRKACLSCDLWLPGGNLGLGKCRHPSCGCTALKRWLPTETCPLGKWPRNAAARPLRAPGNAA